MTATWTKEEALEGAVVVRKTVRGIFEKHGHLSAMAHLFATHNPETGQDGKGLVLMPAMGKFDRDEREFFSRLIKMAGEACRAMGVVFSSEVWSVDPDYVTKIGYAKAVEEFKNFKGSLENHPARCEGIWVSLEHHRLTGTMMWFARITRDGEGKPTLGEWQDQSAPGATSTGRFLHLLPRVN